MICIQPNTWADKKIPFQTTEVNPSTDFGDPSGDSPVLSAHPYGPADKNFGLWTEELHKPLHFRDLSQMSEFECFEIYWHKFNLHFFNNFYICINEFDVHISICDQSISTCHQNISTWNQSISKCDQTIFVQFIYMNFQSISLLYTLLH